ncbi:hypothetical protein NSA48_04615 [Frisingicoccus caecimuris]|uniref:Uncharacterized protein n=1 Tax=Frisingicoccus caecimuris TaxID=1796636 RepID=A0A4R2LXD5_9FIRM|nr:hypothetical protein [Frisingicoccus caecimuris]MCR1918326.1 hypothetical protein [Frisingicoccus caecimuris]TCO84973.1 hypothetical protein EV212_10421 [Frisingicoccus caecimuris]
MSDFIKILLNTIKGISFVLVVFFGVIGFAHDILGPDLFEKTLAKFNIPWNFELFCKMGYICVAILIITYFIHAKLFGK